MRSERPLGEQGEPQEIEVVDLMELVAESAGLEDWDVATVAISDTVLDELVAICGEEHVFSGRSARFNRARVPSPFLVHRWDDYVPDIVVLPTSAEQT